MSYVGRLALVVVIVATLGCGREAGEADPASSGSAAPLAATTGGPSAALPVDTLQTRAETALREHRYYVPAGDSAIEHYLALRERIQDDPRIDAVLAELQPYLLIASEEALARGDLPETQRLLSLLGQVDDAAPALPRLREGLRRAQMTQQPSQGAAAVAEAEVARTMLEAVHLPVVVTDGVKTSRGPLVAVAPVAPASQRTPETIRIQPTATAPDSSPPTAPTSTSRALPRLLADVAPRYPYSALRRKIEGSVKVRFTIQPDGSVGATRLIASDPEGIFEEAALAAVARWRFEATSQPVITERTLSFRLPTKG